MMGSTRSKALILLVALLMVSNLFACGQPAEQEEAGQEPEAPGPSEPEEMVIKRAGVDPLRLDNQVDTTNYVLHFSRQIFNSLVRVNPETLELEGELAERWDVSDDNRTYTFYLRPNVKYHNGETVKASDVKFTFERILRPETGSITQWVFAENIEGAEKLQSGEVDTLDSIKVIDDLTVSITLKHPFAPFLKQIATGYGSIYPEEACAAAGTDWALNPIGSGPFRLAKWEKDSIVVLEKFEDYWEEGKPIPDRIEYIVLPDRATAELEFEAGNLDWMTVPVDRYDRYADTEWTDYIAQTNPYNTYFLAANTEWGPLKDVRVREALSLGIDRQRFVDQIMGGHAKVAKTLLPPGIPGYDASLPELPYDAARAKELLAEAGYPDGVEIKAPQSKTAETTFRWNVALQAMFKEIGIEYSVEKMDRAAYVDIVHKGNREGVAWGGWWADYLDPHNFHYPWFHSKNTKALSVNYNNPEIDALLDEAVSVQDPEKRAAMYTEVERLVVQRDFVVIPVFHKNDYAVTQPWLKGVVYLPPTALPNYINAYIEREQ